MVTTPHPEDGLSLAQANNLVAEFVLDTISDILSRLSPQAQQEITKIITVVVPNFRDFNRLLEIIENTAENITI